MLNTGRDFPFVLGTKKDPSMKANCLRSWLDGTLLQQGMDLSFEETALSQIDPACGITRL